MVRGAEHIVVGECLVQQATPAFEHAAQAALARSPGFAAHCVVGDDQGVPVEHRALESRIGTHVLAHLLAQETCVAPCGQCIEQHPELLPATPLKRRAGRQLRDRAEKTDEGESRPQREYQPQEMFRALAQDLLAVPRSCIELHPAAAVAFGPSLHPQEYFRPDRLRTGVPAPYPAGQRSEEEQGHARDNQQHRQEDEILRPEIQPEDVELARRQVEQHGLPSIPAQPRKGVEHAEQYHHGGKPQGLEPSRHVARVDLPLAGIEAVAALVEQLHRNFPGHSVSSPAEAAC